MVSFIPLSLKKEHSLKWHMTKFFVIFCVLATFYLIIPYFKHPIPNSVQTTENFQIPKAEWIVKNETDDEEHHCNVWNVTTSEQCNYVRNETACGRYIVLHYCVFDKVTPVYYILIVIWVFMLFYLLGNTAENYFVPALTKISEFLQLSPNVAGVTFLALGNGAPDLSSIIVGVFQGSTGFGVGEPIGAGVFVTTVVLGLVSILADTKVTRRPFLRDSLTYLVAVCFAFYMFLNQRVAVYESVICIVLYFIYVAVVVFGRMLNQWWKRRRGTVQEDTLEPGSGAESEEEDWSGEWKYTVRFVHQIKKIEHDRKHLEHVEQQHAHDEQSRLLTTKESFQIGKIEPKQTILINESHFHVNNAQGGHSGNEEDEEEGEPGLIRQKWDEFMDSIEWHEKRFYQKILFVCVEWYWNIARNLTVFKADPNDWNKWFAAAVPIFAPMLWIAILRPLWYVWLLGDAFPFVLIFVLVGMVISFLILITSQRKRTPIYHPIFVIAAFFCAIFWLYMIARELLEVLSALGVLLKIPESILAVTVLAWGNSIGDLVSDVVVAREGFPSMAVGAIFGSPSLNLLIGLGIAMTFNATSLRTGCFPLAADANVALSFVFLICSLIMSIIVIPLGKFKSYKLYGVVLIGVYCIYLGLSITMLFVPQLENAFTWNIGYGCPK